MSKQKHIKIIKYEYSRNKCEKLVLIGYFKPTVDFIDYLLQNNGQHLPIQYDNKVYHVVVDKFNTIPYKLAEDKILKTKLDKIIEEQIPQNSPEFLGKEQYYALFFEEFFYPKHDAKIYFPPKIKKLSAPPPPPTPTPPPPPPLGKKHRRKKKPKKIDVNYTPIAILVTSLILAFAFGWVVG